ncbi:UNVERIFIED_CONTAM: hypothetical protein NCL1_42425 [Trichonephila clavipes]
MTWSVAKSPLLAEQCDREKFESFTARVYVITKKYFRRREQKLEHSVQGNVFLRETDLNTEGLYRCEASAESPTFQTVEGEKMIKVYVIPTLGHDTFV